MSIIGIVFLVLSIVLLGLASTARPSMWSAQSVWRNPSGR